MLKKLFSLLTSPAAAEDECRSFGTFIANKFRNYLLRPRGKVQHEKSNIFAADLDFDVSYPVSTPYAFIQGFLSRLSYSAASSEGVIMVDLMYL